jgi:hypothetical protein
LVAVLFSVNPNKVAGAGELTVSVKDRDAVAFGEEESATWRVKLNCPAWLGDPTSDPVDCKAIPVGNVPEVRVQV